MLPKARWLHISAVMQGIVVIALLSIAPLVLIASCLIPAPLTISDPPDGGNSSRPNVVGTLPPGPDAITLRANEQKELSVTVEDTDGDAITVRFFREYDPAHPTPPVSTMPAVQIKSTPPTYSASSSFAWCVGQPNEATSPPIHIKILVSDRGFDDTDGLFTSPRAKGLTSFVTLAIKCIP